jgi:hypothetical protein
MKYKFNNRKEALQKVEPYLHLTRIRSNTMQRKISMVEVGWKGLIEWKPTKKEK